jgi:hypothetical protein
MRLARHLAPAWPAAVGLVALAVAGALVLIAAPRWRAEAEARLAELRAGPLGAQTQVKESAPPAADKAVLAWPVAAASPRRAAALSALARRSGMELLQLREQLDVASQLQLSMNGRATYPALRQFVERALAGDQALVLDRLRLHRGEAEDTLVDFEMQWTLLHRVSVGDAVVGAAAGTNVAARP